MRQGPAGAAGTDDEALGAVGKSLVALHDRAFLLGLGLVIGGNSLLPACLMYRSRLVPRFIAVVGLVGGPLIFASSTAVLFGLYEQGLRLRSLAALPVSAWEMSPAVRLIAEGFEPPPLSARNIAPAGAAPVHPAAPSSE